MPTPINSYVVKVHSRCNLDCTYCYEYNRGNSGWKLKPHEMSIAIFRQMCFRIRDHAILHKLPSIDLAFHGGEPLLRSPGFFEEASNTAKSIISSIYELNIGVQTNAILLSDAHLEVFFQQQIRVGVSLDGPIDVNDKFRVYKKGAGSYTKAVRGISKMVKGQYRDIWGGLLAVIDVGSDPISIFRHLATFNPPTLDFLEPDGIWDSLPTGKASVSSTEYGDWLIAIFDDWFAGDQQIRIRKFEEIMQHLLGGYGEMEYFGLEPVSLMVIATDGSFESVDQIKAVKNGIEGTGLNVFDNAIDDALESSLIRARQIGREALCEQCCKCAFVTSCCGGYFPHRYNEANHFKNPSVYCADYLKLFPHIQNKLIKEVGIDLRSKISD
ncbi:MAG: FxsB family cyclophane-forming radical SAM/SPASM peptide maturase [Methylovulum sp.]|nr:FxsB family cyclophane-forming radical SAM/SPASM peptide maturase [Methylovulum sp.]